MKKRYHIRAGSPLDYITAGAAILLAIAFFVAFGMLTSSDLGLL